MLWLEVCSVAYMCFGERCVASHTCAYSVLCAEVMQGLYSFFTFVLTLAELAPSALFNF